MANPVNARLAAAKAYAANVAKEARQYKDAWNKANNGTLSPAEGKALEKKSQKELGQMAGAILQGRRYDSSGNQVKIERQMGKATPIKRGK